MYILIALVIIFFIVIGISNSNKVKMAQKNKVPKILSPNRMNTNNGSDNTSDTLKISNETGNYSYEKMKNTMEELGESPLGLAAEIKREAQQAIKDKDYNKAWGLLHEQKSLYIKHANACGFSARNTLSIDANVHEDFANILRLERKHYDAFFHILYWVIASYDRPIKKHEQKLVAYFNRCKFKKTTIEDIQSYIKKHGPLLVNVLEIKEQVRQWKDNE